MEMVRAIPMPPTLRPLYTEKNRQMVKTGRAHYWAVTKAFHSIIQYSEIVIHTDHLNLKDHLNLGKATTKRRQRWCYYLGDYNIVDVIHEKGATFTDCDTLSRLQIIPQAPSKKIEDFVGAIRDVATEPQRDIPFAFLRQASRCIIVCHHTIILLLFTFLSLPATDKICLAKR